MNVIISNKYQSELGTLDIDVSKNLNGEYEVEEIVNIFKNYFFNKMIIDITSLKNYKDINNIKKLSLGLDASKIILFLDDSLECSSSVYLSNLVSMGLYNFSRDLENIKYLINNPNSYEDVAHLQILNNNEYLNDTKTSTNEENIIKTKIIGFKNITDNAGATTLIYILKKYLEKKYSVVAIEMDKQDFSLFKDKDMFSTDSKNFANTLINAKGKDILLIDINNSNEENDCDEVIYLIEPTMIKLNKLIRRNKNIFKELKDKKIVLNKSLINESEVKEFEYESKSKIFFNLPPLNEKKYDNDIVFDFLRKLGFLNFQNNVKERKFKWFK